MGSSNHLRFHVSLNPKAAQIVPTKNPSGEALVLRMQVGAAFSGNSTGPATFISMRKTETVETEDGSRSVWPLLITIAVAAFGVCSMLVVDHGLWNVWPLPKMARYATTEDAAKAVGATVTPTAYKPALEPVAPGPKPVQPAIPDQKRG
jgi:hypothetical protein